jgi:hypothetical protein
MCHWGHGFFKKGEIADISVQQLGKDGKLSTRDLAERVMVGVFASQFPARCQALTMPLNHAMKACTALAGFLSVIMK